MDTKAKIAEAQAKLEDVARLVAELSQGMEITPAFRRASDGLIETTAAMSELAFEYACERAMEREFSANTEFGRRAHEQLAKAFGHLRDAAEVQKR